MFSVESVLLDGGTNRVVLSGTARSQDDLARPTLIAAQFAGSEGNVANIVTVAGNQQVMLKVTVAEVGRDTVKQLGINLDGSIGSALSPGFNTPQCHARRRFGRVANGTVTAAANIGPVEHRRATLQALERRGALRTLAEPTLTAMSGQEAEFLAGGEFPLPHRIGNGHVLQPSRNSA